MAISVNTSSPINLNKEPNTSMGVSSPVFSPSSDKRFWSTLRTRIDTLLENQNSNFPIGTNLPEPTQINIGKLDGSKLLKEDSLLLLRGFDSISCSLSQLTNNLDNALQGARDLAKPPTLTEMFRSNLENNERAESGEEEENEEDKKGVKRKLDQGNDESHKEIEQSLHEGKLKKAKKLAISMATKADLFARELKSIKSELCFMHERCALLEEENRRLRDGFVKGLRPEEDDLVRLQLEALLAEKSRLANENANLIRENQCLNQLVEYHQLTSQQDFSSTYEEVIRGMCLDFSSPPPPIPEETNDDENEHDDNEASSPGTPRTSIFGLSNSLDDCYSEEQE